MGNKTLEKSKKRIAFYIGSLCTGGAERVICNLAEYFYSQDYEVYMVTKTVDEPEYTLDSGIPRIIADITKEEETGSRIGNLRARIRKLRNIWREIEPDIIVSFIKKNNLMALASAVPLKISVVVSVRSAPARELSGKGIKPLSFLLFRRAAGIVLQTNEAKEFFPEYLKSKISILPNSLNPAFVEKIDNASHCDREKTIVAIGRIDDNKNQKMLVDAFSLLADRYPDWSLHLYGDGEGRKSLEKKVSDEGLYGRVTCHGVVDNVADVMSRAGIFVLPSKIEGMPNALIEAMAMGMPCISTDCPCGGPRDLIEDGVNGYLVPVDDVDEMADRLEKLLLDSDLRKQLGAEALKIVDKLHPDIVNLKWKAYIEDIIG